MSLPAVLLVSLVLVACAWVGFETLRRRDQHPFNYPAALLHNDEAEALLAARQQMVQRRRAQLHESGQQLAKATSGTASAAEEQRINVGLDTELVRLDQQWQETQARIVERYASQRTRAARLRERAYWLDLLLGNLATVLALGVLILAALMVAGFTV